MSQESTPSTQQTLVEQPRKGDFEAVVNLLDVLGNANRQIARLEATIEASYVDLVKPHRDLYAKLQGTITETEAALEVIARRNQQWFEDKKSIATPFGGVKFKQSTSLEVADENISVQLITALCPKAEADKYLRTVVVLNKEALEDLTAEELKRFAITRKVKENFSADTGVIDLGKAVKAADRSDKAASKTAKKAAEGSK